MEKGYTYTSRKTNLHEHTILVISQYPFFYNFNKKKKKKTKSILKEKKRRRRKEETTSPAKDLLRSLYTIRKIVSFEALRAWRSGKSRHDPPQYSSRERWRVAFNFLDSFARLTSSTPRRCRCRVRSFPGRSNFTRVRAPHSFDRSRTRFPAEFHWGI